jgi:hypothetical protein
MADTFLPVVIHGPQPGAVAKKGGPAEHHVLLDEASHDIGPL